MKFSTATLKEGVNYPQSGPGTEHYASKLTDLIVLSAMGNITSKLLCVLMLRGGS